MKIDRLFEEATHVRPAAPSSPPRQAGLPLVQDAPERLRAVLNVDLPALLACSIAVEHKRYEACRVDGSIIGTGAADFTTDNTCYTLKYDSKTFQLFDVPGIEGNEGKYTAMVKAAVAKAHLVVYVNGTNKKPEKATAEKIRGYLNRGTQVSPVVNMRGNADAYEFDEDRISLANDANCAKALDQTTQVLRGVLGDDVLLPGHCVQGLLGFSSLAMREDASTVHPSRAHDLAIQQSNYLKYFGSTKAMFEFSQLQHVAGVLHAKLGTFKEDIVESNKGKVRELLVENISVLEQMRGEHQTFLASVEPEFEKCRSAVGAALTTFSRVLGAGRKNLWNAFFNTLSEQADAIVETHFGDKEEISSRIDKAFRSGQKDTEAKLEKHLEDQMKTLEESLTQATRRLVEDVRRVDFQQRVRTPGQGSALRYQYEGLDMDLSLKDFGSFAFNIGSYAMSGAVIGSAFPVIGNMIGAAVGAVVGAIVSVMGFFAGKEKRIRKAQSEVQDKIGEVRDQVIGELAQDLKKLTAPVRDEANEAMLGWVDAMHAALAHPVEVIERQITLMNKTKNQLEEMPYGTIRPIQF
jgi:hypothetical protein